MNLLRMLQREVMYHLMLRLLEVSIKAMEKSKKGDVLDSMEYREAFANYVRTGKWAYKGAMPEKRDEVDDLLLTDDTSVIIPNTVMREFIKDIKVYGTLFAEVRKINVKGGVEFGIEELRPTVRWITEAGPSKTQAAPKLIIRLCLIIIWLKLKWHNLS